MTSPADALATRLAPLSMLDAVGFALGAEPNTPPRVDAFHFAQADGGLIVYILSGTRLVVFEKHANGLEVSACVPLARLRRTVVERTSEAIFVGIELDAGLVVHDTNHIYNEQNVTGDDGNPMVAGVGESKTEIRQGGYAIRASGADVAELAAFALALRAAQL